MLESRYYVFCPQKGQPNTVHRTVDEARKEAERLAAAHPGFGFMVLRAIEEITFDPSPFKKVNFCKS